MVYRTFWYSLFSISLPLFKSKIPPRYDKLNFWFDVWQAKITSSLCWWQNTKTRQILVRVCDLRRTKPRKNRLYRNKNNDMFRQIETLSLNVQLRKSKCNKDVKKFALIFYPFCTFSPYFPFSCQPSSQQFTLNSSLQLVCSPHSIQGLRLVKNLGRNKTIRNI